MLGTHAIEDQGQNPAPTRMETTTKMAAALAAETANRVKTEVSAMDRSRAAYSIEFRGYAQLLLSYQSIV